MTKPIIFLLFLLLLVFSLAFSSSKSALKQNLSIKIYTYEKDGEVFASAMPELKTDSDLWEYKRRFEYLLINIPEIHKPQKSKERKKIFGLYPDTLKLKRLYVKQYLRDRNLVKYFDETLAPIYNQEIEKNKNYSEDELMEVASKFFYCDKVKADTSVQAHVCVGLNGVAEANWERDYTLLEAFCYEAIFCDFDLDNSQVYSSFSSKKAEASKHHKDDVLSLDQYLKDVRVELFKRMKSDTILKSSLLNHYERNISNLSFEITTKHNTW